MNMCRLSNICVFIWTILIMVVFIEYFKSWRQGETFVMSKTEADQSNPDELQTWLRSFNEELTRVNRDLSLARFEYDTDITTHNGDKLSQINVKAKTWLRGRVAEARGFLAKSTDSEMGVKDKTSLRMLHIITSGSGVSDKESTNRRISELQNELDRIYGTAKVQNYTLKQLESFLTRGSYKDRLWSWLSWRNAVGPKMRPLYDELIRHLRITAHENGYNDTGEILRQQALEDAEDVEQTADELYQAIKPLYLELHTYVRRQLIQNFPNDVDPKEPFIPAHLLGNMWAQTWNVKGTKPYPEIPVLDITPRLRENYNITDMVQLAEDFYTSLGFDKMTESFWQNSMFTRPPDRDVQCHASAYDMFAPGGYRIKMCSGVNRWDLSTIHHEMGHIVYYMMYAHQPAIFRAGVSSAFHEAIGDTIVMSSNTPKHMVAVGLLPNTTMTDEISYKSDMNRLMSLALGKLVFLPYAYLVDKYRWRIFTGEVNDTNYNSKWWQMREEIQMVTSPVKRTEEDFDPGAKFHIAANIPYIRYFFSSFLQFQFYEALCVKSGHVGEIHTCDFYNSKEAGTLLKSMMKYGRSESWRDLLYMVTGRRSISSQPLLNYFKPLYQWLVKTNKNWNKYDQ